MKKVYLGFELNHKIFGVSVEKVLRVSQIVEITPIPQAPSSILGIINFMGQVVPVVDLRKRLNLSEKPLSLTDYLIIVQTAHQTVGFTAESIIGLIPAYHENDVPLKDILQNSPVIERVIKENDRFILIIDSEKLLNRQEVQKVQKLVDTQHDKIYPALNKITA